MGTIRRDRAGPGFTLIELMIVVAIVGVLAVLATYGVRKYIANAKTAEARGAIGQISKLAMAAFERENSDRTPVTLGSSSLKTSRYLCVGSDTASGWTPGTPPRGKRYQSIHHDWTTGDYESGWQCLRYSMEQPQYFSYRYSSPGGETAWSAEASGDLNGDGTTSLFTLGGAVTSGVARTAPAIAERSPEE